MTRKAHIAGWLTRGLFVAVLGLGLAGCQQPQQAWNQFAPEDEIRQVDRVLAAQAAAAAREDAMLYPRHFDGTQLNSLGKAKLHLMADPAQDQPLVVYLNVPDKAPVQQQRQAVLAYAQELGLAQSKVEVRTGPNPGLSFPAEPGVKLLNSEEINRPMDSAYSSSGAGAYTPSMVPKTGSR